MSDDIIEIAKQTAVINAKFDAHERQDETRFAYVAEAFKDIRTDLKKQTWLLALVIGGFIALSKLPDFLSVVKKAGATTLN